MQLPQYVSFVVCEKNCAYYQDMLPLLLKVHAVLFLSQEWIITGSKEVLWVSIPFIKKNKALTLRITANVLTVPARRVLVQ